MKFIKLLIITILVLFPFGEILRFDIGNNIVIKPLDVVIGLTALWWLFIEITQNSKPKIQNYNSKLKIALVSFAGVGFVSLIANLTWLKTNEFFVALLYLVRWITYALTFFAITKLDEKFKHTIKKLLFLDGLVILIIGYLQYFFYNNLRNLYYLGWDEHMHRMFSVFFDPNFFGSFLVLYFIFIGGMLINQKLKTKDKVFLWTILVLTLIAVFLTFSRSAILMLTISSITYLFLINKKKLIIAILGIILLFGIVASPKFYDENMNLFREASSKARLKNYSSAWRIFQDHPLIGVGFNSYRYTKDLYGINYGWVNVPSHADAGVDNSFLFVLATTGIIGGISYFGIWFYILKLAFSNYKKNIFTAVLISSSIGLFANALFINSLFFAPIMLWMWVLIGLTWSD